MATELQDLVASLGAVYWQDPMAPEGYVLSGGVGPNLTHIVNLIDSLQLTKAGTNSLQIGSICNWPGFTYNVEGTSSKVHVRRDNYTAVTSCLQTDFTLMVVTDPSSSGGNVVLHSFGNTGSPPPGIRVLVNRLTGPDRMQFSVEKSKNGGAFISNSVTTTIIDHQVYELLCTNAGWEMLVAGASLGSGSWSNSGSAWLQSLVHFQSGAYGHAPSGDFYTNQRKIGQMALFPSILSASDRALVRDAMTLVMCNGHGGDNPIWASTDF